MNDTILEIRNISKSFGENHVLNHINLSVKKGEFITFLGPSGCGKTTMLRIIAGLETPDTGQVFLEGNDVTALAPNKRSVNTIFQNYALFPHMNIEANIGYGLKVKGVKKEEIKKRVADMLSLVQLEGFGKNMPTKISGGQKQRVAIARAAINNPSVLLLDEPLGALDLQLRRYMQEELKKLQRQLGITFIYITHDQEEAMNMSDRIVVMADGKFEQIGTPAEVYDTPKTSFVAEFVGMANIFTGTVTAVSDFTATVTLYHTDIPINKNGSQISEKQTVTISVRSENITLTSAVCENSIPMTVSEHTYANGLMRIRLKAENGDEIVATRYGVKTEFMPGDTAYVSFSPDHAVFVDMEAS